MTTRTILERLEWPEGEQMVQLHRDAAAEIERLREALRTLADAADIVRVCHFESDDLPEEVETMQVATYRARLALRGAP